VDVILVSQGIPRVTQTDKQGKYSLPALTGTVTARATLACRFCRVLNEAGTGVVLSLAKRGQGAIDLDFRATSEFQLSQVSAFYYVNEAHDFVEDYLPNPPQKLSAVRVHVNINQTCNAFWQPGRNTLNFFRSQQGGCPNTAYRDVVFHEYGHGVDDELGGILDGGYSEGFGDALAILLTRDHIIGRDFFGRGQHLRDAAEKHLWPQVMHDDDPHVVGEAYNGFVWELTQQLTKKYGGDQTKGFAVAKNLVLGAGALNPNDIPDAVRLSFAVDAALYPGAEGGSSQHLAELRAAAESRKIPVPSNPANPFVE